MSKFRAYLERVGEALRIDQSRAPLVVQATRAGEMKIDSRLTSLVLNTGAFATLNRAFRPIAPATNLGARVQLVSQADKCKSN